MPDSVLGELPQVVERAAETIVHLRRERQELLEQVQMLQDQIAGLEQARRVDRAQLTKLGQLEQERGAVRSRLREVLGRLEVAAHAD